jgi:hypothetical protein
MEEPQAEVIRIRDRIRKDGRRMDMRIRFF